MLKHKKTSFGNVIKMAYSPTYTSADISPISIDVVASVLAVFASLAVILGLVMFYRYLRYGSL
jgi:hypothetical protein